jgi:hypothetical protein
MRSLKELYPLVLEKLLEHKQKDCYYLGICSCISDIFIFHKISEDEFYLLDKHFKEQKPFKGYKFGIYSKHKKFTKNESFTGKRYWWEVNEEGLNQRIEFIKYLITKL